MYEDQSCRRNASGYTDPTAYRAISRTQDKQAAIERMLDLRRIFYALAHHDGVWVEVKLTDKRTGVSI